MSNRVLVYLKTNIVVHRTMGDFEVSMKILNNGVRVCFWLLHVYACREITVEICRPNVDLTHVHAQYCCNGKKNTYIVIFNNRAKGFIIVDAVYLTISFGDKASFILVNFTCRSVLDLVNPFALNNSATRRGRHKNPSTILHQ